MDQRQRDFLFKQQHYADDPGVTLDDARIAPKGAELNDLWRHKTAEVCREGPYIECHPRDDEQDPFASELAKRVLVSIVEDGTNRYMKVRRRVIGGALGVGTWYAMVHWNPKRGPYGDVAFETMGSECVFPAAGYLDLHDPMCPHVTIERHETVAQLAAKGFDVEGLWPDCYGRYSSSDEWTKSSGSPSPDDEHREPTVTTLYHFTRASDEEQSADGGMLDLDVESQYMGCGTCGFKDRNHERMPDGSLPEVGSACPQCLEDVMAGEAEAPSYLYRVTRDRITEHRLKYPNGKLCIVAPRQHKLLKEGEWPAPSRSFPLWQQRAYESPYEQSGFSDTLLYWSLQALMDQLRKQAYDQMVTSKPILIMAESSDGGPGLVDANGAAFVYDDSNGQIAYAKNVTPGIPISSLVHQFQGGGMPTSLPQLYSILSGSFYQSRGTDQMTFSPDQSRDVAFKSLQLQKESGSVSIEDHKQLVREDEGMFLGIVLDYWVHNSTAARVVRYMGDDGLAKFQLLKGGDIPNVDVVVGSPPQIKQGATEELRALIEYAQLPLMSLRQIASRKLGLSSSEVAAIEADLRAQMQGPPMPGGGMPGADGTPMPEFSAPLGGGIPPMQ